MKKILFTLLVFVCFTLIVKAQASTYHNFKVDIGVGYTGASGESFTIESHYRLSDKFAVGLRYQTAPSIVDSLSEDPPPAIASTTQKVVDYSSIGLTGDYYFNTGKKSRSLLMFGGGGVCVFVQNKQVIKLLGITTTSTTSSTGNSLGFFPRFGIETGHFRASAEYNYTGGLQNYFSVNICFFLGGGKK